MTARNWLPRMTGTVEAIYVAAQGGGPMDRRRAVHAVAGEGLEDDRYRVAKGYWSRAKWDLCQVTFIRGEDLDLIERETSVRIANGEHRRNVVTRGLDFGKLIGRRFTVGAAALEYERPRPPCRYIATLTEPRMTVALRGRSGICARIVRSGTFRQGDEIVICEA